MQKYEAENGVDVTVDVNSIWRDKKFSNVTVKIFGKMQNLKLFFMKTSQAVLSVFMNFNKKRRFEVNLNFWNVKIINTEMSINKFNFQCVLKFCCNEILVP